MIIKARGCIKDRLRGKSDCNSRTTMIHSV